MSQSVREFVRQSGVEVRSPNSNDNNFARELEMEMERKNRMRERLAAEQKYMRPIPRQVRPVPRAEVQFPVRRQSDLVNTRAYEGAFKQFETNSPLANEFSDVNFPDISNNNVRELFSLNETSLEISKLNPGMFNATVDSGYGQKDIVVDLKKILTKTPLPKRSIGEGLYVETHEIKGIYGQFKTGFSHTRNLGPKGNLDKNFFTVQLMLTLSTDTESKGATVNFYRNGKIRFSGGFVGNNFSNQPDLLRNFIVNAYTEKQPFFFNQFTYNNLSGQFRINGYFKDLSQIARNATRYGMTQVSYEPELSPFLYAYFENTKLILSKSGNVQISGAKNPRDMLSGYDFGKTFIRKLEADNQIAVTGVFNEGIKAKTKKVRPSPKKKTTKNSKVCTRMKKSELMNFARRVGVVNFRMKGANGSKAATKDVICQRIKNKMGNKNVTFKNANKKKNVSLSGTGNKFRVGRKICGDMKKDELLRVAAILKIKLDEKETKASLCKKIEKARNNLNKPKTPPPPKPTKMQVRRTQAANKRNVKKAAVVKKRGLDENSIRKDITKLYGEKWMKRYKPNINKDVRNMKSALNAITKGNKSGIPFKKNVDQVKKTLVNQWKLERRRELERKYLMNTVNVTGVAYNLRNDYRRAAANYIMSRKTAPSNKKMDEYRKYWLKFRANVNTNGNSRRSPRAARARIEKI